MARKNSLDAVYAAIYELRALKEPINPTSVAQKSGLRRSTFYQSDPDWIAVLEMIEGARPVPLPSVMVPKVAPTTSRRYMTLSRRVNDMEKTVAKLREAADSTHKQLLSQLIHYISLSKSSPNQRDELSKLRRELSIYEQQYHELRAENRALVGKVRPAKVIPIIGTKRILSIPNNIVDSQLLPYLSEMIEKSFEKKDVLNNISSATLVCGFPLSGRSTWAAAHSFMSTGISIYVEGIFHTAAIRSSVITELRRRGIKRVGCAWLLTPAETCLDRALLADDDDAVPDLIERLSVDMEIVTIHENFDFILRASNER